MKKKQQILIVDDEEVNRTILNGLFQDEYERARDSKPLSYPDHTGGDQQPCAWHGASMAESVLWTEIFRNRFK